MSPASSGIPLLYPAIRNIISSKQIVQLNYFKFTKDGFVVRNSAPRKRLGEVEGGALMCDEIAYLMSFPCVL